MARGPAGGGAGSRMNGTATDPGSAPKVPSGINNVVGKLIKVDPVGVTTYWNGSAFVAADPGYILTTSLGTPGGTPTTADVTNGPAAAAAWGESQLIFLAASS